VACSQAVERPDSEKITRWSILFGACCKPTTIVALVATSSAVQMPLMGQDEKTLIRLWHEKRGEVGPEDLSANLTAQLEVATEDLNRVWYERNTEVPSLRRLKRNRY
jgi:hypothetical protein